MADDKPKLQEVKGHSEERFLGSDVFELSGRNLPPPNGVGTIREDAREIDIYHKCDVAVIGGGPAGCAAAWAAAKAGADVTLVERYNCLGGLSTGGLVMWIDRMTDWHGNHVIQGFAREFIERMPPEGVAGPMREDWGSKDPVKASYWGKRTSAFHGIVSWAPTLDPERMKLNAQEMLLEAGVRIVFHAWAARPVVEDGVARGVVFESKAGRQALMAKVVVDTTGDGDMFARAGAEFDTDIEEGDVHHSMNTGLDAGRGQHGPLDQLESALSRSAARADDQGPRTARLLPDALCVSWRPDIALFLGPRQSGLSALDVDDMTEVEIRSHRLMEGHCHFFRENAPGFEQAYSLQSASQLGVRHTRRLGGHRADRAQGLGQWHAGGGRSGHQPLDQPEVPDRLGALWQPRAACARRDAGSRAAHHLRCQQPRLHARDPAMLADRPCGRRRRGRRGQSRHPAARSRRGRSARAAAQPGRASERRRCREGGRGTGGKRPGGVRT